MKNPALIKNDPWLEPCRDPIVRRMEMASSREAELTGGESLQSFASGHLWFGLHQDKLGWVMREWAPNAKEIFLLGSFNNWKASEEYSFERLEHGNWEIKLKMGRITHGDRYKLLVQVRELVGAEKGYRFYAPSTGNTLARWRSKPALPVWGVVGRGYAQPNCRQSPT